MKKNILVLFTLLGFNIIQAQKLSSKITDYYEFDFCSSPHTIVLKEIKNKKYKGILYTTLKKSNKKNEFQKDKIRKTRLDKEKVKNTIGRLNQLGIKKIDNTYDDDSLVYLDGDALTIKLLKNESINTFYFDELYPIKCKQIENYPLRKKVQNWITLVDEEFDVNGIFSRIKTRLRKGKYCYFSGAVYKTCFTIK